MKSIPVDLTRAGTFKFIDVAAKTNQDKVQTTNQEGVPQWKMQVLLTPAEGKASLEEITIPGQSEPRFAPMTDLVFQELTARHWEMGGRSGVTLSALRAGAVQQQKAA